MTAPMGLREDSREGERLARVTLSHLVNPGDARLTALVSELGAEPVVALVQSGLGDRSWSDSLQERLVQIDPIAELERAAQNGIRFVMPGDEEWPQQVADLAACAPLQECGGVPIGLWVKGELDLREATSGAIAVVGSRAATTYGEHHARSLSADLAGAGRTVVSGASFGIDQAAHRGAVAAGGTTIAVLPCGVDRAYPTAHTELLATIAQSGLVVSECPPAATPSRAASLARNRIAAGLCEGTVLVEGAARSGALNTARWTSELQRPLLAVPGPVSSVTSDGVHQLIRSGDASLVTRAADVLEDLAAPGAQAGSTLRRRTSASPQRGRPIVPSTRTRRLSRGSGHPHPAERCGQAEPCRWERIP